MFSEKTGAVPAVWRRDTVVVLVFAQDMTKILTKIKSQMLKLRRYRRLSGENQRTSSSCHPLNSTGQQGFIHIWPASRPQAQRNLNLIRCQFYRPRLAQCRTTLTPESGTKATFCRKSDCLLIFHYTSIQAGMKISNNVSRLANRG